MGPKVIFAIYQEQDLFAVVTIERTGFSPHERAAARSPLSWHIQAIDDDAPRFCLELGNLTHKASRQHHNEVVTEFP